MNALAKSVLPLLLATAALPLHAQEPAATPKPKPTVADPALAQRTGADEHGMRQYVLVILKTGPKRVPDGEARDAMFKGHFANMERLSKEGKLVVAGPFSKDPAGWRGLFVFAVGSIDEARKLTETDPVIVNGEMVAEYHVWYGSAAMMLIPELHEKIAPKE